jgi:hypothetical protein
MLCFISSVLFSVNNVLVSRALKVSLILGRVIYHFFLADYCGGALSGIIQKKLIFGDLEGFTT